MHDVIIVGVPLLAILAGILFNRSDLKDFRVEATKRFDKLEDHLARIDADLRQFYHLTGKLEARMDNIEKRG